ncbi:hypothetical protein EKG37_00035 [Robertmurraya yapensis]|uniref:CTP synthase n=1 Tax=Bacillus yapensis TaxID=2492960 RepID=A0A3S0IMW6_9BACI|nr:DUF6241 domain-containing protein [Bacillus yapensis]RTR35986.1 hypothetical protein EKG37_00035 [Bacillus yapensis]TKT05489.1 hypothetical protein FAR12_00035 [Bacillus yapensis]
MKKIIFITVGFIAIVIVIGVAAFFTYKSLTKESVQIKETTSQNVEDGEKVIEIIETDAEPVEEEFPMEMSEEAIKDAIHGMSHQKVRADEKWGFIPLTAERVNRLITIVEQNKEDYENASIYLDILNRWSNNDFSQVDHDHNKIWDLQNGTIGKATGILSSEEEKEFIEEHFDIE